MSQCYYYMTARCMNAATPKFQLRISTSLTPRLMIHYCLLEQMRQ